MASLSKNERVDHIAVNRLIAQLEMLLSTEGYSIEDFEVGRHEETNTVPTVTITVTFSPTAYLQEGNDYAAQ
jgi:hypothetical protein